MVDDNASNRDLLFRRLSHDGHHVARAASGHQSAGVLEVEDFDLILLDLLMPDLNGFQCSNASRPMSVGMTSR